MNRTQSTLAVTGLMLGAALLMKGVRRARRIFDLEGRVVLITGGSRGLGLLLARECGEQGARIVLVARDEAELSTAAAELRARGIDTSIVAGDLSSESEAKRVVNQAVERLGQLDVLVNNAGVITVGPLDHMSVGDFEEAMAVHFWAPLHTMRAAVPHMRRAGGGRIVNISSVGGRVAVPHMAPYSASKFALTGLSSAFQAELSRENILVTTVCPGLMRTGSPFNAMFKGDHRSEFAWFAIADSLPLLSIDGRRAAVQIVEALRNGDPDLVITFPAQLAIAAAALMPDVVAGAMGLVNRLLPAPTGDANTKSFSGWDSASAWAPSVLTRSSERSATENNEIPHWAVPSPT